MIIRTLRRVLLGALLLAAPAGALLPAAPASAETLRWAYQSDALSLDPHANNETMTLRFLSNVYDPLVTRSRDHSIEPALAVSWTTEAPDRWRFVLRQGVTFQGGESFDADDVVFSLARAASPSSNVQSHTSGILRVEKVDSHTVDIVTKGPRATLLNELANILILDEGWSRANNAVEVANNNQGRTGFTTLNANGSGAYRVQSRAPDQRTVLLRNTGWWGKNEGNVDTVVFTPVRSDPTRMAALISGELDLVHPVPTQDIARLRAVPGVQVLEVPEIRTLYFGVNHSGETLLNGQPNPLRDLRVREAIYRAIDIEAVRRTVMRGAARPTGLLVGPGVEGYSQAEDRRLPYDPDGARRLLREAGYPEGFALQLRCPNDRYVNDEAICVAVSAMLARVGIRATLLSQTKSVYFQRLLAERPDMYLQGWTPNSFDALEAFFYNLATRQDDNPTVAIGEGQGTFNAGRYRNPDVDALLKRIGQSIDRDERRKLINEVHTIFRRDIAYVPLHQQVIVWAARRGVTATPLADDTVNLRWITVTK
ncbi:ABC transporter substrate-binding protein [Siccirubricoccus phaeus]|uniref:ABC transporter substrate-binding protein n=1 Tax=Siccirubricoccus phaeus TaxID=2595053 RepID=UPI0011F347C3|nr:ABC transporter substrate-binding protein [Siccirubricoccus phaeus]